MFDPSQYQPLSVFFDFEVGGLSQIYHYPNSPISMLLTLPTKDEAPTVVFTLFDEAASEIEPYLWDSADPATGMPGGTFSFGYKGTANIESKKYSFTVQDVVPMFTNNAFIVTVYAFITSATPITSSNTLCGTVEEIIDKFCEIHKLEKKIEPAFSKEKMMDIGKTGRNTTEKQELKFVKSVTETDLRFLNRVLTYAVDSEGKPGYFARLYDNDGTKELKIIKVRDTSADYQYVVQKDSSVVIDWRPKVSYCPVRDEADTQVNGMQKFTGYTHKQALNQAVSKDRQTLFGKDVYQVLGSLPEKEPPSKEHHICSESMEDSVTNGAIRQRGSSSRTPFGGSFPAFFAHINKWMDLNSAELIVAGDPDVDSVMEQAVTLVDVDFRIPINYFNKDNRDRHYTSGIYPVDCVVHEVQAGQYRTMYSLGRPMVWEKPIAGESKPKGGQ